MRANHVGRHDVRRARAGDQHRAPMTTSALAHGIGHIGDVRIQAGDVRAHRARRDQLVAILVEHDDLGAEARGAPAPNCRRPRRRPAPRRGRASRRARRLTRCPCRPAAGAAAWWRTASDRRPAMSLMGASSGSRPARSSTVSNATAVRPMLHQPARELGQRREVQITKKQVILAQSLQVGLDGLLDLHDHLGFVEELVGARHHRDADVAEVLDLNSRSSRRRRARRRLHGRRAPARRRPRE